MNEIDQQLTEVLKERPGALADVQAHLAQSEKMAALGLLMAGIAHEITNPVTFISSGLPPLERGIEKLVALIPAEKRDECFEKVSRRIAGLLEAIGDGARRTAETVQQLRTFSRLDESERRAADLHAMLDSTLTLLHHQAKDRVEVVKHYGEIPPVECYGGQLNQVFMNALLNAVQAIDGRGTITLTTAREGDDHVRVSIRDSGCGIPGEVLERIFDPFFTTKPAGQGTGLGLSISQGIVERHRGRLEVESELGEGTELTLILPIRFAG